MEDCDLIAVRQEEALPEVELNALIAIPGTYRLPDGEQVLLYKKRDAKVIATSRIETNSINNDSSGSELGQVEMETSQMASKCREFAASLGLEDEAAEKEAIKNMIKDLHEYNEIKDLAQILIGKIAQLEGTTTRGLYPKFGLELDD